MPIAALLEKWVWGHKAEIPARNCCDAGGRRVSHIRQGLPAVHIPASQGTRKTAGGWRVSPCDLPILCSDGPREAGHPARGVRPSARHTSDGLSLLRPGGAALRGPWVHLSFPDGTPLTFRGVSSVCVRRPVPDGEACSSAAQPCWWEEAAIPPPWRC